jgi:hypothetical protein
LKRGITTPTPTAQRGILGCPNRGLSLRLAVHHGNDDGGSARIKRLANKPRLIPQYAHDGGPSRIADGSNHIHRIGKADQAMLQVKADSFDWQPRQLPGQVRTRHCHPRKQKRLIPVGEPCLQVKTLRSQLLARLYLFKGNGQQFIHMAANLVI